MTTITVNISKETNEIFRRTVHRNFGKGKGKLGYALDEALRKWAYNKEQKEIAQRLLSTMRKGINIGFKGYKKRAEVYDRKIFPD